MYGKGDVAVHPFNAHGKGGRRQCLCRAIFFAVRFPLSLPCKSSLPCALSFHCRVGCFAVRFVWALPCAPALPCIFLASHGKGAVAVRAAYGKDCMHGNACFSRSENPSLVSRLIHMATGWPELRHFLSPVWYVCVVLEQIFISFVLHLNLFYGYVYKAGLEPILWE